MSSAVAAFKEVSAAIDARINIKHVHRRLQIAARLLIVGTFIDDALRVLGEYRGQMLTMRHVGWGASIGIEHTASHVLPGAFIAIQSMGVALILSGIQPQVGCVALSLWAFVHPFLYSQQRNLEFVLKSVTIIGGLLILLSSERKIAKAKASAQHRGEEEAALIESSPAEMDEAAKEEKAVKDRLLIVGRCALSAVFVYYVVKMINELVTELLKTNKEMKDPLVADVMHGTFIVLLMVVTALIVVGMKSRWCAMLLALIMAGSALYKYPWFVTMWSTHTYPIGSLNALFTNSGRRVSARVFAGHQRYFFFQQLSTAGALLLLVVHGPGHYSLDESEGPQSLAALTTKGFD